MNQTFDSRGDALAASFTAQAEAKRANDEATRPAARRAAEAAAIGSEFDPESIEQGEPT